MRFGHTVISTVHGSRGVTGSDRQSTAKEMHNLFSFFRGIRTRVSRTKSELLTRFILFIILSFLLFILFIILSIKR